MRDDNLARWYTISITGRIYLMLGGAVTRADPYRHLSSCAGACRKISSLFRVDPKLALPIHRISSRSSCAFMQSGAIQSGASLTAHSALRSVL